MINAKKRKKAITRQLYHYFKEFDSVLNMKAQLAEELSDEIEQDVPFDVGYFEGRQSTKRWIVCNEDLSRMYSNHKSGSEISLWCDLDSVQQPQTRKRKNKDGQISSSHQEKEEAVDSVYSELVESHNDKYTKPQLRLWARMITCGIHESYEEPPDVPMLTGSTPKHPKKDSLSNSIADAA